MAGWINTEVLEGWNLLVKKGGNTMHYCDVLMKHECVFVVDHAFGHFGVQHGIGGNAITDYVIGALHESFYERDDGGYPSSELAK